MSEVPRRHRFGSRAIVGVWAAAIVVAILAASAVAFGVATSSPRVCSSCHEMRPAVATWRVSPHAQVACYSCHATPRPWYQWPQSLLDRGALLRRDVSAHMGGSSDAKISSAVPDSNCLHCHDPARVGTSRFGVVMDHKKHAERNKSCVSCHRWTGHTPVTGNIDTLLMKQCFKCHGQAKTAKAPGTCSLCHIKGVDLHPVSHKSGDWLKRHGKVATADRQQCVMCHEASFCQNCHGVEMPHPTGWAKGKSNHAVVARKDRSVCEKCHVGKTALCTMCHHRGFEPTKGPWLTQHFRMVEETGSAFCMQCHQATFCVDCHMRAFTPGAPAAQ